MLKQIEERDTAIGVLKEALEMAEKGELEHVVILGLTPESQPLMITSIMSNYQRQYLYSLAQACAMRHFLPAI